MPEAQQGGVSSLPSMMKGYTGGELLVADV
jgi:hypothetical protein